MRDTNFIGRAFLPWLGSLLFLILSTIPAVRAQSSQLVPLVTDKAPPPGLSTSFGVPPFSVESSFGVTRYSDVDQNGDYAFIGEDNSAVFLLPAGAATPVRVLQAGDPVPSFPGSIVIEFVGLKLNNSGTLAFEVGLVTQTGANAGAILMYSGGSLKLIVESGQTAPGLGGSSYGTLGLIGLDNSGNVGFGNGSMEAGAGLTSIFILPNGNSTALLAATAGNAAPGTGGTFSQFDAFTINNGQVLFSAPVTGGNGGWGLFLASTTGVTKVVANEDNFPAPLAGTFSALSEIAGLANTSGQVAFALNGDLWMYSLSGPTISQLAAAGTTSAPGPVGGTFSGFSAPLAFDNFGDVAFAAGVTGGSTSPGLFRYHQANLPGNPFEVVAYEGQSAPAGGLFTNIDTVSMNNNATVSFRASLSGGMYGLFQQVSGASTLPVALDGQSAPGGGTYQLNSISYPFSNIGSLGYEGVFQTLDSGKVYFAADLLGGVTAAAPDYGEFLALANGGGTTMLMNTGEALPTVPSASRLLMRSFDYPRTTAAGDFVSLAPQYTGGRQSFASYRITSQTATVVVTDGDLAPGTGGGRIRIGSREQINSQGTIAVYAFISGGTGGEGVFLASAPPTGLQKVAVTGDNTSVGTLTSISSGDFFPAPLNANGQIVFEGSTATNGAQFLGSAGTPPVVVVSNSSISNFPVRAISINQTGNVALVAQTGTSTESLYLWSQGNVAVQIASTGTSVPGGTGTFSLFGSPVLNNGGQIAFLATVTGGAYNEGVFVFNQGTGLTALATEGSASPGGGGNFAFNVPPITSPGTAADVLINDEGDVAFLSPLTGGSSNSGLFVIRAGSGTVQALQLQNQFVPGGAANTSLSTFIFPSFYSQTFQLDQIGNISFSGTYQTPGVGNGNGLWHIKTDNTVEPILVSGSIPAEFGGGVAVDTNPSFFWNDNARYALWAFASGGTFSNGIFLFVPPGGTNTSTGSNVQVTPTDVTTGTNPVTITFDSVTGAGSTSLTISSAAPALPSAFQLGTPPLFYNISTTATFTSATVCINFGNVSFPSGSTIELLHYQNGAWVNVTTSGPTGTLICGQVSSFSPFAVVSVLPCAADVSGAVSVVRSGYGYSVITKQYSQTITLTNTSTAAIAGPLSFVLDGLSSGTSLVNPTGTTACAAPPGGSYITVPGPLNAGANVTLHLLFNDPTRTAFSYTSRVLSGGNQ